MSEPTLMAIPSTKWVIYGAVGLVLVVGNALAFWPLVEASRQMHAFCGGLGPGMSWADIRARADDLGYEVSPVVADQALVQDPRSYGRRECQLRFDGKGLAQAR